MRASIIIVCYNGVQYLEKCLSALHDDIREDEIILVDNASQDGSVSLVEEHWLGVKLIANASNRGFAAACNQGARVASGEYLAFLNQDTQVCPGWLDGLLAGLNGMDGVGMVTSKLLIMSQPDRIQTCGQDVHFTGLTFGRGFSTLSASFPEPAKVGAVSGAAFAIRRELWEQLGGFDEGLYMYYEDTDLSWRALLYGYHSLYAPDSVAYHDYRPTQPSYLTIYYSKRNRYILLLKSWRWFTLLLLSPSLILAEMLDWLHAVMIGWRGLKAKLCASVWLLRHLPGLLISCQKAQMTKKASDLALLEHCVDHLNPVEYNGGFLGGFALPVFNALFQINAGLTRNLYRSIGV